MTENILLNNLDELLDRFESQWEFELSGIGGIRHFISAIGLDLPNKALPAKESPLGSFIRNLVEIDIDRWWIHWSSSLPQLVEEHRTAAAISKLFAAHASLEKYLGLLPAPADAGEMWQALIEFEIQTRTSLGDQIGACCLSNRLGIDSPVVELPSNVEMSLDRRDRHPEQLFQFPLRGYNVIGRQRSFDSSPCFVEELPAGNRIVIAGRAEAEVSREQLTIQLLSPEYAIVSNISQTNSIFVHAHSRLAPNESIVVRLPISISVANHVLQVRRKTAG